MIANNNWLIWSSEHDAWWMPNRNGYTKDKDEAGRYPYVEALEIVRSANQYTKDPNESMILDDEQLLNAQEFEKAHIELDAQSFMHKYQTDYCPCCNADLPDSHPLMKYHVKKA